MDKKISKPNFFSTGADDSMPRRAPVRPAPQVKRPAPSENPRRAAAPVQRPAAKPPEKPIPLKLDPRLTLILDDLEALLEKHGMKTLAADAAKIRRELERKFFTVAVVGEFSKGKSTFINKMMGKDFLPTGNLPTTAMLTKIRYNPKEMLVVFDEKGRRQKALPLCEDSWDGLTANFSGNDPKGIVLAGINSRWLCSTGIEIEDTPGAGDLDEERVKITGEALQSDDGAIITVSATAAMSMSERVFIEQRLITPKTPYLMIIITKFDQVPVDQRPGIVEYVKDKLKSWNRDIPVFVPYKIEFPDDRYTDIVGMDKVRAELERWTRDPQRKQLTEDWILRRIGNLLSAVSSVLDEQSELLDADEQRREEIIRQKKERLSSASVMWNDLRTEMTKRCDKCYGGLLSVVNEGQKKVIERLQYEVSHNSNPRKWWEEDYPYRLKVEVMGLASSAESHVSRTVAEDIRWLNRSMNERFKMHVSVDPLESSRKRMRDDELYDVEEIRLKDLNKQRAAARIGTAAITAVGYALAMVVGVAPIFASLGISTGSSLVSENVFKGKIEKQQETLKEAIARNVPQVVCEATADSRERITDKYNEVLKSAKEQEETWMKAQMEAIGKTNEEGSSDAADKLREKINDFNILNKKFDIIKNGEK